MLPHSTRPSRKRQALHHRLRYAVALVVLTALALLLTTEQAMAMNATLPPVSLSSFSSLVDWFTSGSPLWGRLPQQEQGTAAGRGHHVSAAGTRANRGVGRARTPGKGELPAYAPFGKKVVPGQSATQVGFNARTSTRVASKSTATSDYFQNADGSVTRRLAQGTINYRDSSGNWQTIDTSVQHGSDGRWHERANSVVADFAPSSSDAALAHVALPNGGALSYGLQGAASVAPEVSGAKVTYRQVLPGTDLRLQPTVDGLKESVILDGPSAANLWVFPLNLRGLTPALAADGGVVLYDASGKQAGVIPPAYAYDSAINPKSGEPSSTHKVTYRLSTQGGRAQLVMTLDASWLHAPGRAFPVTVDPSFSTADSPTTYAESQNPGDHEYEQTMKIGSYDSGGHDAVSYISFPNLGLDGSKVSVSAASLTLYDTWASTCTAERFDVAPITQAWTPSQVTSYPGPTYGSSIGNLTPSVPTACANTGGDLTKADTLTVPLSTSIFNTWAAATGSTNDYGLAVYASTSDSLHWKQFLTQLSPDGLGPYLTLTYTGALLPQIIATTPANNQATNTLTPLLSATGWIDPNIGTVAKYDFQVYDTSGNKLVDSGLVTTSSKGQTSVATYTVPAGKLKWGQTYYWEVQSYDGTNYSAGPNWQALTTQVPQPVVTSGLSQNTDGHGYSPAIGNYTTTATDANVRARPVPDGGAGLQLARPADRRGIRCGLVQRLRRARDGAVRLDGGRHQRASDLSGRVGHWLREELRRFVLPAPRTLRHLQERHRRIFADRQEPDGVRLHPVAGLRSVRHHFDHRRQRPGRDLHLVLRPDHHHDVRSLRAGTPRDLVDAVWCR
jgi:hypothetical protein